VAEWAFDLGRHWLQVIKAVSISLFLWCCEAKTTKVMTTQMPHRNILTDSFYQSHQGKENAGFL
jgi:hypothetical protein